MTRRQTRVLVVKPSEPDESAVAEAGRTCREGGLVAFPTETVYGLGTNALDAGAVRRLFAVKQRPITRALSIMVASVAEALPLAADVPPGARKLMDELLPGPLTIILRASDAVLDLVIGGCGRVGIRVPDAGVTRAFLEACRCPVAAPSANIHGTPSPRSAEDVMAQLDGVIDLVLDGGPTELGVDSSVIDMTTDPPTLLRPGALSVGNLERALGQPIARR